MKKAFQVIIAVVLFVPHACLAWGKEGHHIVAEIAYQMLSDKTRANVMELLGTTTFDEASTWMDDMRQDPAYDYMKPWHYINIEKGAVYAPGGADNIVSILLAKQNELSSIKDLSPQQIKTDLLVLFHLIGDLHQPLHDGYAADRGGNTIDINFKGQLTNLHALWDSKIIQEQKIGLEDCRRLMHTLSPEQIAAIQKINVVSWMNESRSYLGDVYDFSGTEVGEEYAQKNKALIEKQLVYAGLRLAAMLEKYFGYASPLPKAAVTPAPAMKTIGPADAANHIGETLTVCGKVFGSKYLDQSNGAPTLINMGATYPDNSFTIVIFGSDRSSFSYKPEEYLNGKTICVTGPIKLYKGKPEIIVEQESQIQVK